MDELVTIVGRILDRQPLPSARVVMVTAVLAGCLVGARRPWRLTRHIATMVHEAAHGLVAAACGRRLVGIRLHTNSSGVAVSAGRPTGPGMILTAFAGYPGPSLLGVACAAALSTGYAVAVLCALTVGAVVLLTQIRNVFGAVVVLAAGTTVAAAVWRFGDAASVLLAHLVTWFLLLAAPRTVIELARVRRSQQVPESDADQLGRLTGIPGGWWVAAFFCVAVAALALGAVLMIR
ncbi:MAG: M50 family metallopeptidase [Nocardioides sp.]